MLISYCASAHRALLSKIMQAMDALDHDRKKCHRGPSSACPFPSRPITLEEIFSFSAELAKNPRIERKA
jgi:hypothetical protein